MPFKCHVLAWCPNYLMCINGELCQYMCHIWTHWHYPCDQYAGQWWHHSPIIYSELATWPNQSTTTVIMCLLLGYRQNNFPGDSNLTCLLMAIMVLLLTADLVIYHCFLIIYHYVNYFTLFKLESHMAFDPAEIYLYSVRDVAYLEFWISIFPVLQISGHPELLELWKSEFLKIQISGIPRN